jgi:hypothetical protein
VTHDAFNASLTPYRSRGGRPSRYSEEMARDICERISLGESLRMISRDAEMPALSVMTVWISKYPEFQVQYARAREAQADALFDEILEIADDGRNDYMLKVEGGKEAYLENGEALRRSQMRIDARKWMAGKLRPKKYGEKHIAEVSGPDGSAVQINATRTLDITGMSSDQLDALEQALMLTVDKKAEGDE